MKVQVLVPRSIAPQRPDRAAPIERIAGRSMGCGWSVTYVPVNGPGKGLTRTALSRGVQEVLGQVVAQMSTWEAGSDIMRFNRAQPGSWLALPPLFARVLACALRVAAASGGALDPTAGELVNLWGFGAGAQHRQSRFVPPDGAAIVAAVRRCDWQRLEVDQEAMRVYQPGGLQLDLSAVAKGFAVDEVSRYLLSQGIGHHLVEAGGELRGAGMKPDGQPWWVEVQQPATVPDAVLCRIALHNMAVATSGDYQQGFRTGERYYSHCLDPRSGRPIDNAVRSVTVLHEDCMEADAWATALMVLGTREGLVLAEQQHLAVQFWTTDRAGQGQEYGSSAWCALQLPERAPGTTA